MPLVGKYAEDERAMRRTAWRQLDPSKDPLEQLRAMAKAEGVKNPTFKWKEVAEGHPDHDPETKGTANPNALPRVAIQQGKT